MNQDEALNQAYADDIREFQELELQLESLELEESLNTFTARAWSLVESAVYVPNWHIDAICEHLTAVSKGEILYLLITMPPRHSKSLVITVMWPCWEWIRLPQYRWVFASYAFNLSVRDSVKRRTIIKSPWYRQRFADRYAILKEQDSKIRYENDHHGFMLASSVGGSNTGEGGERIVADDPHNVKKAESEEVRTDTVNWWNVVMPTRRNDELVSARIVVQQRIHEGDVAGDIIERGGAVHLSLPAEFVPSRRCFTSWTSKETGLAVNWADPRTVEGELLNPLRFGQKQIDEAKLQLGDYQYSAQFQQDPTPPKGSIIESGWFRKYGGPNQPPIPNWERSTNPYCPLLSLDCGFKEPDTDTDFVAGLCWAMFGADIYLMPICIHERLSFSGTINAVARLIGGKDLDGTEHAGIYPFLKMKLVENKANGPAVISTFRHQIPGFVEYNVGSSSKESRLRASSWRFRAGNIYIPDESICPWVKEYVFEVCAFPHAKKDDYADATSMAILWIGGDPNAQGEPVATTHESTFVGKGDNTETSLSIDGQSPWSAVAELGQSIWRRS